MTSTLRAGHGWAGVRNPIDVHPEATGAQLVAVDERHVSVGALERRRPRAEVVRALLQAHEIEGLSGVQRLALALPDESLVGSVLTEVRSRERHHRDRDRPSPSETDHGATRCGSSSSSSQRTTVSGAMVCGSSPPAAPVVPPSSRLSWFTVIVGVP